MCAELAKRGDFETLAANCELHANYMQMLQSLMMSDRLPRFPTEMLKNDATAVGYAKCGGFILTT